MTTTNPHLEHIKKELKLIEEGVDNLKDVPYDLERRIGQLRSYVNNLKVTEPEAQFEKPCWDCGQEEANPGLDVCGSCYHKRIWGNG
ncbi:hypothetical protein D3C76_935360 [compost metagenome]